YTHRSAGFGQRLASVLQYGHRDRIQRNPTHGCFMRSSHQVICFVAAATLAGCADNLPSHTSPETPTTATDRATISGRVVDASGAPVAGAMVALRSFGDHATSDATGEFTLDVPANSTLTLAT